MTDLESRLAVLESRDKDSRELLQDIAIKLDSLTRAFDTRPHCPAPGSCIGLEREIAMMRKQQDAHAAELTKLSRWQTWMVGAGSAIAVGWTVGYGIAKLVWGA